MFDPLIINRTFCEIIYNNGIFRDNAVTYQACVDLRDVAGCAILELPDYLTTTELKSKLFFIQILLYKTGLEKEYTLSEIPQAHMYFRVRFT